MRQRSPCFREVALAPVITQRKLSSKMTYFDTSNSTIAALIFFLHFRSIRKI